MARGLGLSERLYEAFTQHGGTWEVDLEHLPATATVRVRRGMAILMMGFAAVWGGFPTWMLLANLDQIAEDPMILMTLLFTVIGAGMFYFGLQAFTRRRTFTIGRDAISVIDHSLSGQRRWYEPLHNFSGVGLRTREVRRKHGSYTIYLVELRHPGPGKDVLLYRSTAGTEARGKWEAICRRLDLPAVEESASGLIRREVEDLDKSVGELVREGRIEVDNEAAPPLPGEIAAEGEGEDLVVTVLKPQLAWWGAIIIIAFPWIFIYVGFFHVEPFMPMGIIGLLFEAVVVYGVIWDRFHRRRIRIGGGRLAQGWVSARGEKLKTTLPASRIESVKVVREGGRSSLVVETDATKLSLAAGLSTISLEWLRQIILAKLAGGG